MGVGLFFLSDPRKVLTVRKYNKMVFRSVLGELIAAGGCLERPCPVAGIRVPLMGKSKNLLQNLCTPPFKDKLSNDTTTE
jgi:hypothetical protein